jgi:hypothetical protein
MDAAMSEEPEMVGSLELIGISVTGDEWRFIVGVGKPVRQPTGEWACPTSWQDFETARLIYGESSLQALCLGLSMIRLRLEDFLEKGGRLFSAEGGHEIGHQDLAAYFSGMGRPGPG